jgi:hypothetical protein
MDKTNIYLITHVWGEEVQCFAVAAPDEDTAHRMGVTWFQSEDKPNRIIATLAFRGVTMPGGDTTVYAKNSA